MDWVQIINGAAALVAFGVSQLAYLNLNLHHLVSVTILHTVHCTLLLWYGLLNFALGFGLFGFGVGNVTPYFRYAFAPLLITYSLRQLVAIQRIVSLPVEKTKP